MRKKLLLILLIWGSAAGCTGLKEGWGDFQAYYNTFYNAEEYFKDGIQSNQEQSLSVNLNKPVRVHRSPEAVDNESFEQAIQKCALILKRHQQSKWVDDALLLMGKSYYYLQEFSAAVDRFEQVSELSSDKNIKQQAAIWKGRTLLDQQAFEEGTGYLEQTIEDYPQGWSVQTIAELQVLLGEHHAMLENWGKATNYLSAAIGKIEDKSLLAGVYFLYGQALERQERYGEALFSFQQVPPLFPGMAYTYWALLKQAEVNRRQGNWETALTIYQQLHRNDSYSDQQNLLSYQIAYTLELQGNIEQAEQRYKQLLDAGDEQIANRTLQARIYYRLGRIYSQHYRDYTAAATYFDRSANLRSSSNFDVEDRKTDDLADAYGQYAMLKQSVEKADSLLWLGELPKDKLNLVLGRLQAQRRQELLKDREENTGESLVNQQEFPIEEQQESSESGMYGFLNYRSENLTAKGKKEFRSIWGDRPLVDNWRRRQAIRQVAGEEREDSSQGYRDNSADVSGRRVAALNLEAIPQTLPEKKKLKAERATLYYQLGNVLFLDLNQPDSAAVYFHKVINSDADSSLHSRAMYALHELFSVQQEADSSRYWAKQIRLQFPNSQYARLINDKSTGLERRAPDSDKLLREEYQQIAEKGAMASKIRTLALRNSSATLSSYIHYQAIEAYIKKTKQGAPPVVKTKDTGTLQFDMATAHWDSVRLVLAEHDSLFPNSPYQSRVQLLQEEIGDSSRSLNKWPTCREQDIRLKVLPSMEHFLRSVQMPKHMEGQSLSGEITYSFVVGEKGQIYSYTLTSPPTLPEVEGALESAFEESLEFKPLSINRSFSKIRCSVTFPIKYLQGKELTQKR